MTIPDYALVATLRGLTIDSKASLGSLKELVGQIQPQEQAVVTQWKEFTNAIDPNVYPEYIADELKRMLEIRNDITMPIPISLLGTKGKQRILAYFHLMGYRVIWPERSWTPDQLRAINFESGLLVVNAGPGTGKTTAANERAIRLYRAMQAAGSNSGVIIISYTNEAINENYRRLHEYGQTRGVLGKKSWEHRINVCTADSLAFRIIGRNPDLSYDLAIREAIDRLNTDPSVLSRFYLPGQGMIYSHVIVDECQDIDDLRGELILTFHAKIRTRSLSLFGDPRQRLTETAGAWYANLWRLESSDVTRIGFTHTFRFQNYQMLTLVNTLSERRPDIHHELVTVAPTHSATPIVIYGAGEGYEETAIRSLGQRILQEFTDRTTGSLGRWAVIGPSLERDNKTSQFAKQIFTVFKAMGIPCYTRSDGSFRPNAVLFTTIQSAKGKEFDYVISFGMNGYPESFPMISHSDGESLVYVLHSRARSRIFYFTNKSHFSPPRGISHNLIEVNPQGPILVQNATAVEPHRVSIGVKNVSEDYGFTRLMGTNLFSIAITPHDKLTSLVPPAPIGVDKGFWGSLAGMAVQEFISPLSLLRQLVTPRHYVVRSDDYAARIRTGEIVQGRDEGGNYMTPYMMETGLLSKESVGALLQRGADALSTTDWIEIGRFFDFMTTGTSISIPNAPEQLNSSLRAAAVEIYSRFGTGSVEIPCQYGGIRGYIDILTEEYLIELKTAGSVTETHARQAWIYNCLLPRPRRVLVISLTTGQVMEVTSQQHPLRWRHLLASFFTLQSHHDIMNARLTELIKKGLQPIQQSPLTYYVDTEFTLPTGGNGNDGEIFELAVINGEDIFRSLIQTISIRDVKAAAEWIDQPEDLFRNSPTLSHVQTIFWNAARLNPGQPTLSYYHAPMDVSWGAGALTHNMAPSLRKLGSKTGTYLNGTAPPKLGEIYSVLVTPLEFQPHLRPHTAVSDALMLLELARYGFA